MFTSQSQDMSDQFSDGYDDNNNKILSVKKGSSVRKSQAKKAPPKSVRKSSVKKTQTKMMPDGSDDHVNIKHNDKRKKLPKKDAYRIVAEGREDDISISTAERRERIIPKHKSNNCYLGPLLPSTQSKEDYLSKKFYKELDDMSNISGDDEDPEELF